MMVLGDDPMYLVNAIASGVNNVLGVDAPMVQVAIIFIIFGYFAIKMHLDRGSLTLLSILLVGLLLYIGILPPAIWFVLVMGVAAYATYGVLTLTREGEG